MADDIVDELRQLQRYAAGLHSLLADAQAKSPPQAEGSDSSGAVHVVLAPGGLPDSIRVRPDWNRKLSPEAFGGAVVEAFTAAANARITAWTTALEEEGWQSKVGRLRDELDRPNARAPSDGIPPAFRRDQKAVRPRALDAVAEDVINALDAAPTLAARLPAPAQAVGRSAAGRLVITLADGGLASCTADPQWVSQQTAARLMTALSEALAAARDQLAAAERAADAESGERTKNLNGLLAEALALIENPQQTSQP